MVKDEEKTSIENLKKSLEGTRKKIKPLTKKQEKAISLRERDISTLVLTKQANTKAKQKNFLEALRNLAAWNVSEACQMVGIRRKTFREWIKNDEAFKEEYDDIEEMKTDWLEAQVFQQANQMSMAGVTASTFLLKARGKERGYSDKQEIDINQKVSGGVVISPAKVTESEWCNVAKIQQENIANQKTKKIIDNVIEGEIVDE